MPVYRRIAAVTCECCAIFHRGLGCPWTFSCIRALDCHRPVPTRAMVLSSCSQSDVLEAVLFMTWIHAVGPISIRMFTMSKIAAQEVQVGLEANKQANKTLRFLKFLG